MTRTESPNGPGGTAIPRGSRLVDGLVATGTVTQTLISAALRAVAAAAAGLLLVGGLGLVLWAIMPDDGLEAIDVLRGGVAVFGSAHFLPLSVGDTAVTIHPLLVTAIAVSLVTSAAGRGRAVEGRTLEALHACALAVAYGILVDIAVVLGAPADTVQPGLAAPVAIAVIGVVLALCLHPTAWRDWWRSAVPGPLRVGVRLGAVATCLMVAAGALAMAVSLVMSFSEAASISQLTVDSAGAAYGQLLLGLAIVPNAVIAGLGYMSGAGFAIGNVSYSPFAVHTGELPALPLLAAVPDATQGSWAYAVLAVPILVALLVGWLVARHLSTRQERLVALSVAAATMGSLVALLTFAARGGVSGGRWAESGAPVLLTAGLVVGFILVIAGSWAAASGWGTVPWTLNERRAGDPDSGCDDESGDAPPDAESAEPNDAEEIREAPDAAEDAEAETEADADTAAENAADSEPDDSEPDDSEPDADEPSGDTLHESHS